MRSNNRIRQRGITNGVVNRVSGNPTAGGSNAAANRNQPSGKESHRNRAINRQGNNATASVSGVNANQCVNNQAVTGSRATGRSNVTTGKYNVGTVNVNVNNVCGKCRGNVATGNQHPSNATVRGNVGNKGSATTK